MAAEPSAGTSGATNLTKGFGFVYLERPQRAVPVQILDGARKVLHRAVTADDGTFSIPPGLTTSSTFRIQAGQLELVTRDLQSVWMDVVGHLATLLGDRHPGWTPEQAYQAVTAGLGIPKRGRRFTAISNAFGAPFSVREFLNQAGTDFSGFVNDVVTRLERGEALRFQTPDPYPALSFFPRAVTGARTTQSSGLVGSALGFLGQSAAGDLFNLGLNDLLGHIAAACGWNVGTSNKFNEVLSDLQDIENQVTALGKQIDQSGAQQAYSALLGTLKGHLNSLEPLNEKLIADTSTEAQSANATFNRGPAPAPAFLADLISALGSYEGQEALNAFVAALVSRQLDQNIQLLQNELMMSQKGVDSSKEANAFYYSVKNDALTSALQGDLDYWRSRAVQVCNLLSEAAQNAQLYQSGQVPAAQMNEARANILVATRLLSAAQNAVTQPIFDGTLFMDTPNQLMWYYAYGSQCQYLDATGQVANLPGYFYSGDWTLPSQSQLETLRGRVGNTAGLATLGFIGLDSSSANPKLHTSKAPVKDSIGGSGETYYYYNFDSGDTGSEDAVNGGPLYSWLAVRSIGTAQSLKVSYSEDAQDDILAMGYLPTYLILDADTSFASVAGGYVPSGAPDTGTIGLTSQALWEIENQSALDPIVDFTFVSSVNPYDSTQLKLMWHKPGTVTLKVTVYGTVPGRSTVGSISTSTVLNSPLNAVPPPSSVRVSPQNLVVPSVPANIQLCFTGYLPGGTAQDLTGSATWTVDVASTVAYMDAKTPGNLVIVDVTGVAQLQVKATSGGQSDTATVVFPAP